MVMVEVPLVMLVTDNSGDGELFRDGDVMGCSSLDGDRGGEDEDDNDEEQRRW